MTATATQLSTDLQLSWDIQASDLPPQILHAYATREEAEEAARDLRDSFGYHTDIDTMEA